MPQNTAISVRDWLRNRIAEHTGEDPTAITTDRPFEEFGLSSRDAVAVSGELETLLGRPLPATLLWENPTIDRLAAALTDDRVAVEEIDVAPDEPVAVVGVGCRFPGGNGPAEFWSTLQTGVDAIGEVPAGRWENFAAGQDVEEIRRIPRHGGFLHGVDEFDADFFGISAREAEVMDPQQRLLLEVSWEALEDAGLVGESLRGSPTGVFVGVSSTEYSHVTASDVGQVDAWTTPGAAASVVANRVSYTWDLRGPSVVVDTACSSSLVAVHQACASLRSGECTTAVAAGVNVLLSPMVTASFAQAGALADDGRCKPFDAAADGMVRGEGCGVVVLKRLSAARRDGDRVLGVVRGSAVNSDGRSNGLMAPNPASQVDLLRSAYARAGVDPSVVDYVEAHGTGTLLGDPIEAGALAQVLGRGRSADRPLLLGSVKSNVGHLEAAAGVAGLIKVVLGMRHGQVPASLHYSRPNPHIPFERHRLGVVDCSREWPRYSGRVYAGVSGFGFGGTNAHLVLEAWPQRERRRNRGGRKTKTSAVHTLTVSGQTPRRLRRRVAELADWLESTETGAVDLADVGYTLARRTAHLPERGAAVGREHSDLVAGLRALAAGSEVSGTARGTAGTPQPGAVWVLSGYGSQWTGMCARLLDEPAFCAEIDRLDPLFRDEAGFSLHELIAEEREPAGVRDTQLALFGVQLGLAQLWRSYGVTPAAVVGHSMGEVTASVIAGALDAASGLRVMRVRATLLAEVDRAGSGAMAVLEASAEEVERWAAPGVEIAVHFSPRRCTVAGPTADIEALVRHVDSLDRMARTLPVSGAGHTAAVDGVLEDLRAELSDLDPANPVTPVYSTSADPRVVPHCDAAYWVTNVRNRVRFADAVRAAAEDGFTTFLELSPHPVTTGPVEETLADLGVADPVVAFSSRRNTDDAITFHTNLARLHTVGRLPDLTARYPKGTPVDLPRASWEHRSYWRTAPVQAASAGSHPALGTHVELPGARHAWQGELDLTGGNASVATVAWELVVTAAVQMWDVPIGDVCIEALTLDTPLATDVYTLSTSAQCTRVDTASVELQARSATGRWIRFAGATVRRAACRAVSGEWPDGVSVSAEPTARGWWLNGAIVERCLQTMSAEDSEEPASFEGVRVHRRVPERVYSRPNGNGSLLVTGEDGEVVWHVDRVRWRPRRTPSRPVSAALWEIRQEEVPLDDDGGTARGSWLLASTPDTVDVAEELREALSGRGHRGVHVDRARLASGIETLADDPDRPPRGAVLLTAPHQDDPTCRVPATALADLAEQVDGRVWWAHGTGTATPSRDAEAAHAVARVATAAHPSAYLTLLAAPPDVSALSAELFADEPDDEVCWRDGRRAVARLRRADLRGVRTEQLVRAGTYLVTGGGYAVAAAERLGELGASRIVLRAAEFDAAQTVQRLRAHGVDVDLVDGVDEAELVRRCTRDGHALCGVVHMVGDGPDAVDEARRLHAAVRAQDVDWWVAVTDTAALLGTGGASDGAAVHGAVADLVWKWRADGFPAAVLHCADRGEGPDDAETQAPGSGEFVEALEAVLGARRAVTACTWLDPRGLRARAPVVAARPFVGDLADAEISGEGGRLLDADAVAALPGEEVPGAVMDHLRRRVAEILGTPSRQIDQHAPLNQLGFDSLMATRARNAVERDFGTTVPNGLLLRGGTLADIAAHVVEELGADRATPPTVDVASDHPGGGRTAVPDVGPRDATERWVAHVWRQALDRDSVAVKHDFFALGGDAALAEKVAVEMRERLGEEWDTARLFAEPTVERMAELVRERFEGTAGPVRVLREHGSRPPLFLFHPAGGPTSVYQPLVHRLGEEQPCYGFERLDEYETVEAKAEQYIELIRTVQAHGPYRLGGWSFGGALAYEVARRLSAAGEDIDVVALIDTTLPLPDPDGTSGNSQELLLRRFQRFAEHIEQTYGRGFELDPAELAELSEHEQIERVMTALAEANLGISEGALRHQYTSYVDSRVAERYQPRPLDERVVLYRAQEVEDTTATLDPRYHRTDDTLGWDEYATDLEVVRVPGDHLSMIDPPHVEVLAEHLGSILDAPSGGTRAAR